LEKIRLYIDEDLSDRVAVALRSKGFDAISAHEVNMRGKTDKEQLDYAIKNNRIILTRNTKHFINLQREYHKEGLPHNGILVTDYLSLKELIRRLTRFLNEKDPSDISNTLDWLQNYK
jgi:predicted nuclease of predicted toxin-antitoxin system